MTVFLPRNMIFNFLEEIPLEYRKLWVQPHFFKRE